MRAIRFDTHGEPDVLHLVDAPRPEPRAGQLLVRVAYVGVNFADTLNRKGLYQDATPPPAIPGMEASGIVEAVGPGVEGFRPGDRVAAVGRATYAEYAIAHAHRTFVLPPEVDLATGAALPIQGLTAYYLLFVMDDARRRRSVLVHAAAGGTGLLCVQMAKRAGALVIGTTSSAEKARRVREAGADHVINYAETDFADEARRLTDGRGVDLILDSIGRSTVAKGLEALAPMGHLCMYGFASGSVKDLNPMVLFNRSVKLSGMILGRLSEDAATNRAAAAELLGWIADGSLQIEIEGTWLLEEAAEAHRAIESRKTSGKLLLRVSE